MVKMTFDTLLRAVVLIISQGVLKSQVFKKRFLSETTAGACQSVDGDEPKGIEMDQFSHGTQSVQQLSVIGLLLWCGWEWICVKFVSIVTCKALFKPICF